MKRLLVVCSLALVASLVTVASCKQDDGDRCQIDDDCVSPLVCNTATTTCQSKTAGAADANIIDAALMDAPVDAVPDAP